MTRLQLGIIGGTVAGWCACLVWRWFEDRVAADRAARDLRRAWNAAEAKARLRMNVQRIARERRAHTSGNDRHDPRVRPRAGAGGDQCEVVTGT